jgi:two-component system, OmpR family, sensor kinase
MSRLPIRVRLTAGFAVLVTVVLALAGLFIYERVGSDLDATIDRSLRSRADDVAALVSQADSGLAQGSGQLAGAEESFAQVLRRNGTVLDSTPGATVPALGAGEIRNLTSLQILDGRTVPGIEGQARLLASPISAQDMRLVVVVGTSVAPRDEALAGLVRAFAVGGPIVVLLVSGAGYLLASLGLAPVEAMRRRADEVTLEQSGERLPLPPANDEIRRLGETLNAMLSRLEASFERERMFVADASHELRTPLAVLRAELEVALRRGGYDDQAGAQLEVALEEVDHLSRLAEDLLLIARSEDGGLAVEPEWTTVRELLDAVAGPFRDRAAQDGRSVELDAPADLEAHVDPFRIRQALANLIDNALRHGRGRVLVRAGREGSQLVVTVEDAGPGFPRAFVDRAFERFSRADPSRGRRGAGLGLGIVRAIARGHGGEASIESSDLGSAVVLRLPLVSPAAREAALTGDLDADTA